METQETPISTGNVPFEKTIGILAYCTLIGWIIALVMNSEKQGEEKRYNAFHIRQMLGLFIFAFGLYVVMTAMVFIFVPVVFLFQLVWLGFFVLWLLGLIAAVNGQRKPIPVIGQTVENMLGTAFE